MSVYVPSYTYQPSYNPSIRESVVTHWDLVSSRDRRHHLNRHVRSCSLFFVLSVSYDTLPRSAGCPGAYRDTLH